LISIKSFFSFIIFLLIATGFFFLIRFEIHYGVAGGKFGGAEINKMPGTFWFFIGMQAFLGLFLLVTAIKELRNFLNGKNYKPDPDKNPPHEKFIAIYWLLATLFFLVINLLAIWSAFEMVFSMYGLIKDDEMSRKAILGSLFLVCIFVFCYLYYMFLFRTFIDSFVPKARDSFKLLGKKMK
jgi:polyferredoxin